MSVTWQEKKVSGLIEFADLAEEATRSSGWASQKVKEMDAEKKWAGGTFSNALKLARFGWKDGRDLLQSALVKSTAVMRNDIAPRHVWDVAGDRVNPARAAAGDAFCMRRQKRSATSRGRMRVVRIAFGASFLQSVTQGEVMRYGAALLTLINALEAAEIRVELTGVFQSTKGSKGVRHFVALKGAHDPVELDRIAFAMAHTSMLRQLVFVDRSREAEKRGWQYYNSTMGSTVSERPKGLDRDVIWLAGVNDRSPYNAEDAIRIICEHLRRSCNSDIAFASRIADMLEESAKH